MLDQKTIVAGAREAVKRKAGTYCIVASGRAPSHRELDEVTAAVKETTETMPLKVCACLGLLNEEKAKRGFIGIIIISIHIRIIMLKSQRPIHMMTAYRSLRGSSSQRCHHVQGLLLGWAKPISKLSKWLLRLEPLMRIRFPSTFSMQLKERLLNLKNAHIRSKR